MDTQTTWVKLRDVCDTTSGGTPSRDVLAYYGGDIPWVKSGELLDGLITDTEEKITKAAIASSSAKLFPAGTLLIALYGATVGRLGILGIEATTNQAVCGITPNEQLDRDFLFYYLLKQREKLIDSRTGGAQPNINQEIIRELDIPLPPLTEQKRIASLLARADRLRQLRRTAHDLGDALLQSVFLEMFGDPYRNEKKWKKKNLGALAKWRSGGTPSRENPEYFQGDVPWLSSGELEQMYTYSSNEHISEYALKKSNATKIEIGSLLLGMYDTAALKSTINQVVCACNQAIAYAKFDESKINTVFVYWAIQVGKEDYRRLQRGVRQKNLNLSMIQEISIPVPPLSLQEEFAGVVARVESLRGRMGESTRQVEGLFESLLAQSFDGGQ
jgi:type I restriction enzyme S subunit